MPHQENTLPPNDSTVSTFVFDHMVDSTPDSNATISPADTRMKVLAELAKSIHPKNLIEEMLLSQMVLTYEVSMQGMRRAHATDDSKARTSELNIAMKFSRLFSDQLKTLYMYRNQDCIFFQNDRKRKCLEELDAHRRS